ncbi:MAG TPA: hypothetical protein VNT77_11170 [Allosphingosinicella sp.]|nr:hypothetical protein [Allosphingosinicella sp.]
MKSISTFAIAVALTAGSFAAGPALAQRAKAAVQAQAKPEAQAPGARKFNFSKEAVAAIRELQAAYDAGDAAAFTAKLAAAEAVAKNDDDRFVIAQLRLNQALKTNDPQLLSAIDALIASGGVSGDQLAALHAKRGELHYQARNWEAAAADFTRVSELQPNNIEHVVNLSVVRSQQKNGAEAARLLGRAIAMKKAAGEPVPQDWYKNALKHAYEAKLAAESASLSRELVSAYPSAENWRSALLVYRQTVDLDAEATLDLLRLMRSAKALDTESEYLSLAGELDRGNYPAEAQAVISEGSAAGKIKGASAGDILKRVSAKVAEDKAALPGLEARAKADASGRLALKLADGYFGHSDYAKAADFYRLAIQKGSIDANLANTRLGIALALAGQKAQAETAFNAVTGARKDLASLWLLWLSQRG